MPCERPAIHNKHIEFAPYECPYELLRLEIHLPTGKHIFQNTKRNSVEIKIE